MVVVDDLDTVNEQSQQVFRNYIDKYKHNIHFISVCTNVQKVIESIQSRIHMIHLPCPKEEDVRAIMEYIVGRENLTVSKDAQDYLLKISNGSLRVLINYLEKIYIYGMPIDILTILKRRPICLPVKNVVVNDVHITNYKLDQQMSQLLSLLLVWIVERTGKPK
jgi:replication-associated recombination protein RarA